MLYNISIKDKSHMIIAVDAEGSNRAEMKCTFKSNTFS